MLQLNFNKPSKSFYWPSKCLIEQWNVSIILLHWFSCLLRLGRIHKMLLEQCSSTHDSSVMLAYCVGKGQPGVLLHGVNNWFLFLGLVKERLLGQPVRHLCFFYCFSHSVRLFLLHTHAHNPLWTFHRNMRSIYCVFKLNLFPLGQNHWKLSLWSRTVNTVTLIQTHWVKFCAFGSSNKWKWNSFGT